MTNQWTRRRVLAVAAGAVPGISQGILELPDAPPGQRIHYGGDLNQFGDLRMPGGQGPHPVVIFIHGGYWRARYGLTHAGHFCVAVAKAGCAVWSLEYRRVGHPGGGYPGTLNDIRDGARWIAKIHGLDTGRVVVAGHSAGGQLALWLAKQDAIRLQGVVGLAAVCNLQRGYDLHLNDGAVEDFVGCRPWYCRDRYAAVSPIEFLPLKVPQVLLHGTKDDLVPFEMSQQFVKASGNARLVALEGAGHFDLIDPRTRYWPTVVENITGLIR